MRNCFYKQPKYYEKFKCIGGDCPETCCAGWEINWNEDNIKQLRESECSDILKQKAENCFKLNSKNKYEIILNRDGSCPFLTDDKLCMIQKELGEDIMSYVCKVYPRQSRFANNIFTRVCSTSCYAVIDLLCSDENSVDLVMHEAKETLINADQFTKNDYINRPELNYLNEIFDFLYEILSDKKRDIETSIVLGALAAKKISDFAESGKADMIPEVIKKLRPQLNTKSQVDKIKEMQPNYVFSLGVVNEILNNVYHKTVMTALHTDGKPDINKLALGMDKFNKAFADKKYALRNIIINYFIECFSLRYDVNYSIYDNYLYFAFIAAAVKLSCAVVGYACGPDDNMDKEFKEYQAVFARKLDSNRNTYKIVISYLNDHKWNTPAYIASMIK